MAGEVAMVGNSKTAKKKKQNLCFLIFFYIISAKNTQNGMDPPPIY